MATSTPRSALAELAQSWLGFALMVLAHFALRPLFATRAQVDFMLIGVLFSAVRLRPGLAAVLGLAAGLAIDSLAPRTFGAAGLAMVTVAYAASRIKAVFFADHIALTALFVFLGKVAYDVLSAAASGGTSDGMGLLVQLLLWTPLSAAVTAIVAVVLVSVLRPLFRPPSS